MLVWLTIIIFEFVFSAEIKNEALIILQTVGFFELLVEMFLLASFIVIAISSAISDTKTHRHTDEEIDKIREEAIEMYQRDDGDGVVSISYAVSSIKDIIKRGK